MKFAKTGKPSFRPRYDLGARFGVFEPHVRFGSKADILRRRTDVRFTPKADIG